MSIRRITGKLKEFIVGSEGKTRLFHEYTAYDGDWRYQYEIIFAAHKIGLSLG